LAGREENSELSARIARLITKQQPGPPVDLQKELKTLKNMAEYKTIQVEAVAEWVSVRRERRGVKTWARSLQCVALERRRWRCFKRAQVAGLQHVGSLAGLRIHAMLLCDRVCTRAGVFRWCHITKLH